MVSRGQLSRVHVRAPGKINVFLKVGALQDDGYAASGDIVQGQIGTCYLLGSLSATLCQTSLA